jgi:hypothetical protein
MRRWAKSLWLISTLPFGVTTWAGFLYIGAVGRKAKWLAAAAGYLAIAAAVLALHAQAPKDALGDTITGTWQSTVSILGLLFLWVGGITHGLIANREWLILRGTLAAAEPWTAGARGPRPELQKPMRWDDIDLGPPWTGFVHDAVTHQARFRTALQAADPGPIHETIAGMVDRLDACVETCRRLARHGRALAQARSGIDLGAIEREIAQAAAASATNPHAAEALASFEAQRSAAVRMDAAIGETISQLRLLEARMSEAVVRVLELSAQTGAGRELPATTEVTTLLDDLEALHLSIDEVDRLEAVYLLPR